MNQHSRQVISRLCVFCGSSLGMQPIYRDVAVDLGQRLAKSEITLVYGGARVGLMGILADSVLSAGGEVIGVIPEALMEKEVAHEGLTQLHVVKSMHERKALMADLSDAFLLLPGGFGSWEEFCEIVTWAMLGIHQKPSGILNVARYYDSLVSLTAHAVSQGFVPEADRNLILVEDNLDYLLPQLCNIRRRVKSQQIFKEQR